MRSAAIVMFSQQRYLAMRMMRMQCAGTGRSGDDLESHPSRLAECMSLSDGVSVD